MFETDFELKKTYARRAARRRTGIMNPVRETFGFAPFVRFFIGDS